MPSRTNPVPLEERHAAHAFCRPHTSWPRLEQSINEGHPFSEVTVKTTEQLQALAGKWRRENIETGWADAAD